MIDRDWILILACLVILVVSVIVAVCSAGSVIGSDDPPEPEIEEVVRYA